jgi:hypothetical protein
MAGEQNSWAESGTAIATASGKGRTRPSHAVNRVPRRIIPSVARTDKRNP